MSKKENSKPTTSPPESREISTIRDILMGHQMAAYKEKFSNLENRINQLETALNQKLTALEKGAHDRSSNLEKELSVRFNQLEKLISESVESLDNKIDKKTEADKKRLGKMMGDLSKKLIGE